MTEEGDIVNFTSGSLAGDSYEILDLGEGSWSDTDTEEHTWFKVDESLKKVASEDNFEIIEGN